MLQITDQLLLQISLMALDVVPVEIKMVALCEFDGKLQSSVNKLDLNTRVSWSVVGWNFEHAQFAQVEG